MAAPSNIWNIAGYGYNPANYSVMTYQPVSDSNEPVQVPEGPGYGVKTAHWAKGLKLGGQAQEPYQRSTRDALLKGPPFGMLPAKYANPWGRREEFEKELYRQTQISGGYIPDWYIKTLPAVRVGYDVYTPEQYLKAKEEGSFSQPYAGLVTKRDAGARHFEPKILSPSSRRSAAKAEARQQQWKEKWQLVEAMRGSGDTTDYSTVRSLAGDSPGLAGRLREIDVRAMQLEALPLTRYYERLANAYTRYAAEYPENQDYALRRDAMQERVNEANALMKEYRVLKILSTSRKMSDADFTARLTELRARLTALSEGKELVPSTLSPLTLRSGYSGGTRNVRFVGYRRGG